MQEPANIIDQLGGYKAVAAELGQNDTTIANWRTRGVPWRWRPVVAALAKKRRIAVPENFLRPDAA